jgi:hypothetical protein
MPQDIDPVEVRLIGIQRLNFLRLAFAQNSGLPTIVINFDSSGFCLLMLFLF